jgi:hypothetical protein
MSGNRSKSADAGGPPLLPSPITSPDILVFDVRQLQAILVQSFPRMITLQVAPDSPQWAELADAALGVIVLSQSEPQSSFKTQFGPSGVNFAHAYTAKYNAPPSHESAGGLSQKYGLAHLQAVFAGQGGKLRATVKRRMSVAFSTAATLSISIPP